MIRIDALATTGLPSLLHVLAAMKDGGTVQLSVQQIADLVKAYLAEDAPLTLDTIKEIATALQDNPDVITTLLSEQGLRLKRDGSNFADAAERQTFRDVLKLTSHGQCYLSMQTTSLLQLARKNGKYLTINGKPEEIPETPITLAVAGLTPSTFYYVYAYMSGATMTLEASTTARATDATTGIEIKSGDATRTLVGACYPVTGPLFASNDTAKYVISWFNRVPLHTKVATVTYATASASWIEITGAAQVITWKDTAIHAYGVGAVKSNVVGQAAYVGIGFNGSSPSGSDGDRVYTEANVYTGFSLFEYEPGVADRRSYVGIFVLATSGYTCTVNWAGVGAITWG